MLEILVRHLEPSNAKTDFKKTGFNHILHLLPCIYWGNFTYFKSVNDAFVHFYDIVFSVIKDSVSVVKIKSQSYTQWYTHDLINSIKHKDKLRKKYIRCGRDRLSTEYSNFLRVRAEVKKMYKSLLQRIYSFYWR